ncbi:START domain [Sesbania bispinosa]|nr:START domain [Sesbania bispinosa]
MSSNKNSAENESRRNKGKEVASDSVEVPPAVDVDEAQEDHDSSKRKQYHRHSQHQIQQMEMFFKECPHPDDKQRKALGDELGLDPLKIKFWFQNKRTQVKAQQERHENALLKGENEKLRADNVRYKEALSHATCPTCGGPSVGEMMSGMTAKMMGKSVTALSYNHMPSCTLDLGGGTHGAESSIGEMYGSGMMMSLLVPTEAEKILIVDLAVSGMEELISLAASSEPLWVVSNLGFEILNESEYSRTFHGGTSPKPLGYKTEASRDSVVVIMNHMNLVEILMNVLAERMIFNFCTCVGSSTSHHPTGCDDVRIMTRKNNGEPGRPAGIVLSAATSFWLPIQPKKCFEFLRNENSRHEWDILSNGIVVQELAHITNGRHPGNCLSLFRVNGASENQSNMLMLQESFSDPTGSYVVYAPTDLIAVNVVLSGGDPDYVALLPSGFVILPDGPIVDIGTGTVAFQILVDTLPTAKLSLGSVTTGSTLLKCTVERIKAAVKFTQQHNRIAVK